VKFGAVSLEAALGAIAAHAVRYPGVVLKKGDVIEAAHIAALRRAGVAEIIVAQIEPHEIGENEAARVIAARLSGAGLVADAPFTGRSNLRAAVAGLLLVDPHEIDGVNDLDEAITLATLAPFAPVTVGDLAATVKIIPFAAPRASVEEAVRRCAPLRVAPYWPLRVTVISTLLPGLKPSVVDKTLRVLAQRLAPAGARIVADARVAHEEPALAGAIARADGELTIIFGASAITDRRDVIPQALTQAGGAITHFGMPVDPGNLLLLGRDGQGRPVIGAPGCARSPKENGFDFVLQRILAKTPITSADIKKMGAGGLLKEIPIRPQPRGGEPSVEDEGDEA
jgi:molybdenum cofactor cytidylyltransferase